MTTRKASEHNATINRKDKATTSSILADPIRAGRMISTTSFADAAAVMHSTGLSIEGVGDDLRLVVGEVRMDPVDLRNRCTILILHAETGKVLTTIEVLTDSRSEATRIFREKLLGA